MRITIGGLLVMAGITVGGIYYAPVGAQRWDPLQLRVEKAREKASAWLGVVRSWGQGVDLFKRVDLTVTEPAAMLPGASGLPSGVEGSGGTAEVDGLLGAPEEAASAETSGAASGGTTTAAVPPPPRPQQPQRAQATRTQPRQAAARSPASQPATASPPATPQAAAPGTELVGSYVALELNSGRVIRGVLEERTAASYRILLPGMGPFDYPATDVASLTRVE